MANTKAAQAAPVTDTANGLVMKAREAAGIFTQYNQQEVDRIVGLVPKRELVEKLDAALT